MLRPKYPVSDTQPLTTHTRATPLVVTPADQATAAPRPASNGFAEIVRSKPAVALVGSAAIALVVGAVAVSMLLAVALTALALTISATVLLLLVRMARQEIRRR